MGQNDIQRGGLNSILRRTLNIKGDVPPSPVVGAEIVPVMPLEADRPEWGFLNEERLGLVELNPPPVGAQNGVAILECPANTDLLTVVTKITVQLPVAIAANRMFHLNSAAPANTIASISPVSAQLFGIARDTRYATNPTQQVSFTTTRGHQGSRVGFFGTFIVDCVCPAGNFADFCLRTGPLILHSGYKLIVTDEVVNELFCCCFSYYERNLQPNEKPVGLTGQL